MNTLNDTYTHKLKGIDQYFNYDQTLSLDDMIWEQSHISQFLPVKSPGVVLI